MPVATRVFRLDDDGSPFGGACSSTRVGRRLFDSAHLFDDDPQFITDGLVGRLTEARTLHSTVVDASVADGD